MNAYARKFCAGALLVLLKVVPGSLWGFDHAHAAWDQLLQRYVTWLFDDTASQVDYGGFAASGGELDAYLDALSAVPEATFSAWSQEQRLAFLINAYNAFTVQLVLTRYPDLQSIKELGTFFSSPWKKRFFDLLDGQRSLDEVEHGMIREPGAYDEPRIHFAVNCAAIGCPALRPEAFRADRLESQLEDGVRRFLSDKTRNRYNSQTDTLEVSKIFRWYGEDFEPAYGSVRGYLAHYATLLGDTDADRRRIRSQETKLRFLAYDWDLNDVPPISRTHRSKTLP